jgi:hypothetical protein
VLPTAPKAVKPSHLNKLAEPGLNVRLITPNHSALSRLLSGSSRFEIVSTQPIAKFGLASTSNIQGTFLSMPRQAQTLICFLQPHPTLFEVPCDERLFSMVHWEAVRPTCQRLSCFRPKHAYSACYPLVFKIVQTKILFYNFD